MTYAITISGSFQKALSEIREDIKAFQKLNCEVLSPRMFTSSINEDGFVVLDSDGNRRPAAIHSRHLVSIQNSTLVWIRCPSGYIGLSTALEIGFAHALNIPVYASEHIADKSISRYVQVAKNPKDALEKAITHLSKRQLQSSINTTLQSEIAVMSSKCGFDGEEDQEILELLDEEILELKQAVAVARFAVGHNPEGHGVSEELADCVIYLYHLANQSGIDLKSAVLKKIAFNIKRWGSHNEFPKRDCAN